MSLHEPTPAVPLYGMLAEFDAPERLVEAVRHARAAGFRRLDAYSPFPIEGLSEALAFRDGRLPWLTLTGGILGAAAGFYMQVYTNRDFHIDIGGRPLIAPPAFMLITFELMVLFSVLATIIGMLAFNHLPRLNHPLFDVPAFHLASSSKFFLVIFGDDKQFKEQATRVFLESLSPRHVAVVPHAEERE